MPQSAASVQTIRGEQAELSRQRRSSEAVTPGATQVLALSALAGCWLILVVSDAGFDRYHLPKELALSLGALTALLLFLRTGASSLGDRIDQLALASLLLSCLSGMLATSPAIALRACSLELAITVLFLTGRAGGARARSMLVASVVLAALGVALVALAEGLGLPHELSRVGRAPGSTLGQRNMVAHLLALAAPSAWWLAATERPAAQRWLGALGSACLPAALLLTRSRAGWLGGGAALLSFLTLWSWQTRTSGLRERLAVWLPLVCSGGAVLAVCLVPVQLAWHSSNPYADTLARLVESETGSGAGRLAQDRASLELVALHPVLGAGPGNWMVEYPRVAPARELAQRGHGFLHTGRLPNSDWIALVTERGAVGSVCALALAIMVCMAARGQTWLVPVGATACALLVVGALDAVLQLPAPACLLALVFACGAPRKPAPHARATVVPRLLTTGLCLALVWTSWGATQRALGLWARTRPSGGFAAMESAVRWNDADLLARFMLAEAYALKGECAHARPHVAALERLLPYHRAPKQLGCRDRQMAAVVPSRPSRVCDSRRRCLVGAIGWACDGVPSRHLRTGPSRWFSQSPLTEGELARRN